MVNKAEMTSYWEEQISLIKKKSTQEIGRRIVEIEAFIKRQEPKKFEGFENYLAHLKCEYAERIGKRK